MLLIIVEDFSFHLKALAMEASKKSGLLLEAPLLSAAIKWVKTLGFLRPTLIFFVLLA